MVNLIEQLSDEDKNKLDNYIRLYGINNEYFTGLRNWLIHWAKNKTKLYKLLGNQFIYRVPYKREKSEAEINYQIRELVNRDNEFINIFTDWLYYYKKIKADEDNSANYYPFMNLFNLCLNLTDPSVFIKDKLEEGVKFKDSNVNKKELQLQKGMKPMRALSKIINYYSELFEGYPVEERFEDFRIKHSIIFNDKVMKGDLCISIHPLDFITMSDNSLNWQSCMSWTDKGCYRVGTIEMMNSNNVVCCYLESKEPFYFNKKEETEEYKWNNKKWRQLCYVTKDIIVSGKAYPYANDELSRDIITILRELADKNLNWQYSFGVERYLDMKHIGSYGGMERIKTYIKYKDTKKHNIIFDTKGMYNDMFNDKHTKYWCVRNKVKHNKMISYSGKCNCLCCNGNIIYENDDDEWGVDYNERFSPTSAVICESCLDDFFTCDYCNEADTTGKFYKIEVNGRQKLICKSCWDSYIRICPVCGKPMLIPKSGGEIMIKGFIGNAPFPEDEIQREYFDFYDPKLEYSKNAKVVPLFMHYSCSENIGAVEAYYFKNYAWGRGYEVRYLKIHNNMMDYSKYYYTNLQKVPYQDGLEITEL